MTKTEYYISIGNLVNDLAAEYRFDTAIVEKIVRKADADYHSAGYHEVEQAAYELADLIAACIRIAKD